MALAVSVLTSAQPTVADPLTTASVSPTTSVVFVSMIVRSTGGTAPTFSGVSGLGGTWSQLTSQIYNGTVHRMAVYVGTGCSGSGTLSLDFSATPGTANSYIIFEVTGGVDTTTPVVASNTKSTNGGGGSTTSGSVTPNALAAAANAYIVHVSHNQSEDVTPANSGIEVIDDNVSSTNRGEINYLINPGVAMGGSWTTSRAFAVIGFEVAAAAAAGETTFMGAIPL